MGIAAFVEIWEIVIIQPRGEKTEVENPRLFFPQVLRFLKGCTFMSGCITHTYQKVDCCPRFSEQSFIHRLDVDITES